MARSSSGSLLSHPNIKLDSFLKRNMDRTVYERVRAYQPCVVISETINKAYMHVVLTDTCVYLTEYPPRTLAAAFSFRRVRDIELVNDLPDFLRGKDQQLCQHIRVTYITEKAARRGNYWLRGDQTAGPLSVTSSSKRTFLFPTMGNPMEGYTSQRNQSAMGAEEVRMPAPTRSASCPNPETLGLPRVPHPPFHPPSTPPPYPYSHTCSTTSPSSRQRQRLNIPGHGQAPRRTGSVLSRLLRQDGVNNTEEREVELHLYAISHTSRLYLHLQSSWNSFIIRSTLLLDPLYRGRCRASSDFSPGKRHLTISWERTAHLFAQLSSELLQEDIGVESLYLLLQELRTAAHRNIALCRLFWRSREMCVFLVQTLEESLGGRRGCSAHTADQLLLSTLIVQTLAIMFRENEVEPARLDLLSAEKGALASRMLLALICDPRSRTQSRGCATNCELQALLAEYLDAACSLLFELLLLGHEASRCSSADNFLSVGWILQDLQPHPHLMSFLGYQAQQVVRVLSDVQESFLSPSQSVLLFQRCHFLLACLQYNNPLAQHLRYHFREEFRYFVKPSRAEEKLPPHYPISRPTLRMVEQIVALHR